MKKDFIFTKLIIQMKKPGMLNRFQYVIALMEA